MPAMKSTSASLYGNRPRLGGVAWRPDGGALAQPPARAAASRPAAIAGRETVVIPPPADAWYAIRRPDSLPKPINEDSVADAGRIAGLRCLECHEAAVGGHDRDRRLPA